jgi:hypothetical protein
VRSVADGGGGLPCGRAHRGGVLREGLLGEAQVHPDRSASNLIPTLYWFPVVPWNERPILRVCSSPCKVVNPFSCLILVQTVAMKFILKHGKSDKDIHNLRQEIEVTAALIVSISVSGRVMRCVMYGTSGRHIARNLQQFSASFICYLTMLFLSQFTI